jgi:hypothetical protein
MHGIEPASAASVSWSSPELEGGLQLAAEGAERSAAHANGKAAGERKLARGVEDGCVVARSDGDVAIAKGACGGGRVVKEARAG